MNDDFLYKFHKAPRREFAANVYDTYLMISNHLSLDEILKVAESLVKDKS